MNKATGNWHDIPGILKLIALNNTNIISTDKTFLNQFLTDVLKTVPHDVIMMPWRLFKPKGLVPQLTCDKDVSKTSCSDLVF